MLPLCYFNRTIIICTKILVSLFLNKNIVEYMIKRNLLFLLIFLSPNIYIFGQPSLRQKIAQMIIVGFNSNSSFADTLITDLKDRNLGGVILYGQNVISSSQLAVLTAQLRINSKTLPFIAIDQEGGRVARLNENNGYRATNSAYKLGTIINLEDSTRSEAQEMAKWLSDGGININYAPCVDVNVNPASPAIGAKDRSFSENPLSVFYHADWFIDEFNTKNILTTLKHFPGHGSARTDSHLGFTDVTYTWTQDELLPYKDLINQGFDDNIMVGHIFNSKLDSLYPASLSYNTITNLLKDSLKFEGLIISDEMLMKAITTQFSFEGAIELAINAGVDILLYSTNEWQNRSLVNYIVDVIENKVNSGIIPESRIDESFNKIRIKKDFINSLDENMKSEIINVKLNVSNYPNPFNSSTIITYDLPKDGRVTIIVYDLLGRKIETLVNEYAKAGKYSTNFNSDGLSTGIYFYRLEIAGNYTVGKMIYLK